jgi:hypothetical protein
MTTETRRRRNYTEDFKRDHSVQLVLTGNSKERLNGLLKYYHRESA